jgi:hypothetical protein
MIGFGKSPLEKIKGLYIMIILESWFELIPMNIPPIGSPS